MKKKIFEKILSIGSTLIALVFVIVLIVTMFGGIDAAEFENNLVQGLFVTLGAAYLLLASGTVVYLFLDSDAVKEIVINTDKQTSTKATATVIKKLAKQHIATIEGVKCTKVSISLTEYGVRLKIGIKVVDKEIQEVAAVLKCLLEDVYYETLGYKFYAIDFKVLSLKSTYNSDMEKIEEQAKENLEAKKQEVLETANDEKENVENFIEKENVENLEQEIKSENILEEAVSSKSINDAKNKPLSSKDDAKSEVSVEANKTEIPTEDGAVEQIENDEEDAK